MLTLNQYQESVVKTDPFPSSYKGDMAVLLSIGSEAGEVLEVEKKKIRDKVQYELSQKEKFTELGDVLWGVAVYAHRMGFKLEDIAKYNLKKAQEKGELNDKGND